MVTGLPRALRPGPSHIPVITNRIMKVVPAEETEDGEAVSPSGCDLHPSYVQERLACSQDFRHFLNRWKFKNRESGEVQTFAILWPGQERAVAQMKAHNWLFLLKAGKLGFTELECAFDGWVALYRQPNARVHLFSMNAKAATDLLEIVRFGVTHLPSWLGLPLAAEERGGDGATSFKLRAGPDDMRLVLTFAAVKNAAIDQNATHSHVDELARMAWPDELWSSVESTVSPGGSVHIVTRGAGDSNATADIWDKASTGEIPMYAYFEPWDARPRTPELEEGQTIPEGVDPSDVWYQQRQGSMLPHQLDWLAPRTAEDALRGSSESQFVAEAQWLACFDDKLLSLTPGDRTPLVLGVDAGVTSDYFGIVAVSRHPERPADVAVRAVKVWVPKDGKEIDFAAVENWIRMLCVGGCLAGHPNLAGGIFNPQPGCEHCMNVSPGERIQPNNVVQIAYDVYQLVTMMQNLSRDRIAWCNKFDQGSDRAIADQKLRTAILQREISHTNDETLNQQMRNANAKTSPNEDTKLRIIKRNPKAKIDLVVALSMAHSECKTLIMENAR